MLRGELEMLLALAEYNDIAAMSVRHRRAWELLGRPTGLYPPESTWSMGCPSVLFMFHRESGKLREEIRLMRECMPHYYKAADWHGAGGELLFEAEALYMAGDFSEALRLCRQAETVAALHGQLCNTLCALFLRARLALARKNHLDRLRRRAGDARSDYQKTGLFSAAHGGGLRGAPLRPPPASG